MLLGFDFNIINYKILIFYEILYSVYNFTRILAREMSLSK